ncbi:MAG: hypothetical protein JNK45_11270 [Myxococcales bacterium]|nr:hypothetical protein [Myxococcales bacterium]
MSSLALALGLSAAAPEPALSLTWEAPPECPTAAEIEARVAAVVPRIAHAAVVDARIDRVGDAWRLVLDRHSDVGREHDEMTAARCDVLADVVVVLTSIALDPTATPRPAPRRSPVRVGVAALALGDFGTLPRMTPGGSLGVRAFARWWSVGVRASLLRAVRVDDPQDPTLGADVAPWSIAVIGCATPFVGDVSFPLCVGPETGGMRAQTRGATGSAMAAWVAVDVGAHVVWSIAPRRLRDSLALVAGVEAVVGVRRPGFHLEGHGPLVRAGTIGVRPSLGLEVRFGATPGARKPRRSHAKSRPSGIRPAPTQKAGDAGHEPFVEVRR